MKKGFTLVELSIVLVIIGLLIGGILVGQSLIDSVKIMKTVHQISEYNNAITQFKVKYKYQPGDFPKAVAQLGAEFDGDGDGLVHNALSAPIEATYVYQHLGKSGFLPYKGTLRAGYYNAGIYMRVGWNAPELPYKDVGMMFGSVIVIGSWTSGSYTDLLFSSGLTSPQSMAIDAKMDDGKANTGDFTSANPPTPGKSNTNLTCLSGTNYIPDSQETGCFSRLKYKDFGYNM